MKINVAQANQSLEKKLNRYAWAISIVVFLVVVFMRKIKIDSAIDFSFLPAFHATLNGMAALLLIAAYISIRKSNAVLHRKLMTTALIFSILFLLSYIVYHTTTKETSYCQEGAIRVLYFFLLITHVVLAAVILPFILFTYIRAYTNQFDRHRKIARWVFPLWLYVALTGPVLYIMLSPCYN